MNGPNAPRFVVTPAESVQGANTLRVESQYGRRRVASEGYNRPEPLPDVDVRMRAEQWALRNRFTATQMEELTHLLNLSLQFPVNRQKLDNQVEIDRGSFGTIYSSTYDNHPVAVKEMTKDGKGMLQVNMREIHLELRVLVQIRHPYIVTYWGVAMEFPESSEKQPYFGLVFELCEKGSVHSAIFGNSNGVRQRLGVVQKVKIAYQVATGLAYLHTRRIIHRDMNSKNILLSSDYTAKIADFGAAVCTFSRSHDEILLTKHYLQRLLPPGSDQLMTTTILGSPAYMAPEQMQGHPLTVKVDIWAYSFLLWEMLTEQKPWEGIFDDYEQLKAATLKGERLPFPKSIDGWPAAYLNAMVQGMTMQAAERPTIETIQQSLRSALQYFESNTTPQPSSSAYASSASTYSAHSSQHSGSSSSASSGGQLVGDMRTLTLGS